MKKVFAFILVAFSVFFVFGCKKNEKTQETQPTEVASQPTEVKDPTKPVETKTPDAPVTDIFTKGEGVMTYSEYVNAALDSDVVIEAFIQGVQTFNPAYNNITLYLADKDGAYFVYRAPADQELADKCTLGTKVKVSGTKSAWSGEVEITNATIEFEEGSYIASSHEIEYLDEDAIEFQNQLVTITYAVVQDKGDGAAFLYKYNGSGSHEENSDLYYDVEIFGNTFTFVVESDLCDNTTDVYAAVEGLQVGDVLEITGFLYWYEGPQLHTTSVVNQGNLFTKSEGVMTYTEYANASLDSDVVIEAYIMGVQTFNPAYNNITLYLGDQDGAYFVYRAPCDQDLADQLYESRKVRVSGTKSAWSGEVEITNATIEVIDGLCYYPNQVELDLATLTVEELLQYQNRLVYIENLVVQDKGDGAAFLYKYNGSGSHEENSDLYYDVKAGENTYTFVVESDLCNNESMVYEDVEGLHVGDVIAVIGFLYWYEGPQLHTTVIIFNTDSATE